MSDPGLPDPSPALFPGREVREQLDGWLTQALLDSQQRIARGPVVPTLDVSELRRELASFDFGTPRPLLSLLQWTLAQLESGTVHMTHPRYFGLFNPAPNFPSQIAERVTAAVNAQLASSGSSPAPVEIEAHVIRQIAARAGLPSQSSGHFTTGGSEANCTALLCALVQAEPRFAAEGLRAFAGPVTFYASRECHSAWFKIAVQAGIGRTALRLIGTDGSGRLDAQELEAVIHRDRTTGCVPVMIAATAGTTPAGMIDPLQQCGQLARALQVWYHVDAAWGGAALSSTRLRPLLAGIETADSITIDAHKWFATTMGCGMFITRHPSVLSAAFGVSADFMPSSASALDPYLTTMQWSRRFMGLRLFLTLAAAGWEGVSLHVERSVQLIECVRARLSAAGWSAVNDPALAVLCVVPPPMSSSVRDIARRVLASGRAWVAATSFEGRDVIRICATHGESSLSDVDELVLSLREAASAQA